jgi:SMC interacting uncharacterized protein involved in chromosome segregation
MTDKMFEDFIEELLYIKNTYGYETLEEAMLQLLQEFEDGLREELEEEGISWEQFVAESETMAMADPEYAAELQRIQMFINEWIEE